MVVYDPGGGELATVTGEFKVLGGHEEAYDDRESIRLTRAGGNQEFSGGIDGAGRVEWLMCYRQDRTADYVGIQSIEGLIDGRRGSLVLTATGRFDGSRSSGEWTVVQGSGTGELTGVSGRGSFAAGPGPQATFQLTYELG